MGLSLESTDAPGSESGRDGPDPNSRPPKVLDLAILRLPPGERDKIENARHDGREPIPHNNPELQFVTREEVGDTLYRIEVILAQLDDWLQVVRQRYPETREPRVMSDQEVLALYCPPQPFFSRALLSNSPSPPTS